MQRHRGDRRRKPVGGCSIYSYDPAYVCFIGTVDSTCLQEDSEILVRVDGTTYRAYQCGENDYKLYLKRDMLTQSTSTVKVYVVNQTDCVQAAAASVSLP